MVKIINKIKQNYKKNPLETIVSFSALVFAIFAFLKPSTTSSLIGAIGLSLFNFTLILLVLFIVYYFWRKK